MAALRKHATSIVLVAVAAALGAYVWIDRGSVTDAEKATRVHNVFPAWRREDVSKIEIERGAEKLVLERLVVRDDAGAGAVPGDTRWTLTSPRREVADPQTVDRLLGALEFASAVRKVDGAPPGEWMTRARGTIVMGRVTYAFELGGLAPTPEGASYLRVSGATIVVGKELSEQLLHGADAYRDRTISPYLSIDLAEVDVAGAPGRVALRRVDDVAFDLAGLGVRASRDGLDRFWHALGDLRAASFVDDVAADRAVAEAGASAISIQLVPRDASRPRGEIVAGGACPGGGDGVVVVRRSPTRLAACAPKGALDGLALTERALVDTRVFVAHDDEIAELTLEPAAPGAPAGARVDLARKGSGWHERAPEDRDLSAEEAELASALVASVARVAAVGADGDAATAGDPVANVLPRAGAPEVTARFRARVVRADGAVEAVDVGPATGANAIALVRRAADGAVLRVAAADARTLAPRPIALRGRAVWAPPVDRAPVVGASTTCGPVRQTLTRATDRWLLTEPSGFPADAAAVTDFVDAVVRLRADAWIADADDGTFGLAAGCHVTVDVAGAADAGARALRLTLGAVDGGGVAVRVGPDGPIFVAPKHLRELAATLFVDRHLFAAAPIDVARVTIVAAGRAAAFVGAGDRLARARAGDAGDDAGRVSGAADDADALGGALQSLRADEVVHLGPAREVEGFAHPTLDVRVRFAGDAARPELHFVLGAPTTRAGVDMVYARIDGVDATFAIAVDRVAPLRAAAGG